MNFRTHVSFLLLTTLALMLFSAGYDQTYGKGRDKSGLRPSDPQYDGPRDMNYDHVIIPGDRIGPMRLGGSVRDALRHLGNPDIVSREVCGGVRPCPPDTLYYWYTKNECTFFSFTDSGIDPEITSMGATCVKWSTQDGVHVGTPMSELSSRLGVYCAVTMNSRGDHNLRILTKQGIWYEAKNRNSPVTMIGVQPAMNTWNGICRE